MLYLQSNSIPNSYFLIVESLRLPYSITRCIDYVLFVFYYFCIFSIYFTLGPVLVFSNYLYLSFCILELRESLIAVGHSIRYCLIENNQWYSSVLQSFMIEKMNYLFKGYFQCKKLLNTRHFY